MRSSSLGLRVDSGVQRILRGRLHGGVQTIHLGSEIPDGGVWALELLRRASMLRVRLVERSLRWNHERAHESGGVR